MAEVGDGDENENEKESATGGDASFVCSISGRADKLVELGGRVGGSARLRVSLVTGAAWTRISGARRVVSQACRASPSSAGAAFHFALPIDAAFRARSPRGWPRVVVVAYEVSDASAERIVGYGRALAPTTPGAARRVRVPLFAPRATTPLGRLAAEWWAARTSGGGNGGGGGARAPELVDADALADGRDDYLLQTRSCGQVLLTLSLITKGMKELNYDNVPPVIADNKQDDEYYS